MCSQHRKQLIISWDIILYKSVTTKRALEYQEIQVLDPVLFQAA